MTLQSFHQEREAATAESQRGVLLLELGHPQPESYSVSGRLVNRTRYGVLATINGMDGRRPSLKATLWRNLSALMQTEYGRENLTRLSGDTGIGPGSASRIKAQDTSIGLEVLEKIAKKFGIEPWQLLFPVEESQEFLELCRAWREADKNKRELLLIAGRAGGRAEGRDHRATTSKRGGS